MGSGGVAQPVRRVYGNAYRAVEPEGVVRAAEVVVHGLRHADRRNSQLMQTVRHAEGIFATQRHEGVAAQLGEVLQHLHHVLEPFLAFEGREGVAVEVVVFLDDPLDLFFRCFLEGIGP